MNMDEATFKRLIGNKTRRPDPMRYKNAAVEYRPAGRSGLKLPALSLGLWQNFGSFDNFEIMRDMIFTAFDKGITAFDLANNYGPRGGSAEENFGKILKENFSAHRDEMLISTKAGFPMWGGPYGKGGSRKYLTASLDASLKRMGIEYADIFYHHRPDPETPLEETMGALASAVQQGKALYAGLSNYNGEQLRQAVKILDELHVPLVINQNRYSIFDRTIEHNGLKAAAQELGKGIIAFSPLAQGLLSSRYLEGISVDSRVNTDGRFLKAETVNARHEAIAKLNALAQARGQSLAQMALAWVLRDGQVQSVLIGASKVSQVQENIECTQQLSFTNEELSMIDKICEQAGIAL